MAGCAIPQIALDDGSAPEPIDLRLCYDWGRPPSTSTSDLTASYFYGTDGRLVFELVSNAHNNLSDCDILVKLQGEGPVYSHYSKKRLMVIGRPFDSDITFPKAARKIYLAFQKGSPLYQQVVQEREAYRKRKEALASQPVQPATPGAISREDMETRIIKSDVNELPSVKAKPNQNAYAIVIGVEKYRQKLPKADYADNDARIMAEYLTKVMGYPEENIVMLINDHAAKSDFEKYLGKWLPNNVEKDSSVFIYYSGHGAPNPKTGDAYLVPYDGDPSFIEETGYPLKRLYAKLDKLPAREIIVVLDSCFSGAGGRSVLAKGARPLVMNMDKQMFHSDRIAVLSAAAGNQISSTYEEKGHGLFTYFLLKGIKEGNYEIGTLYNYLKPQVERIARKTYNNEQTPQLIAPNKTIMVR